MRRLCFLLFLALPACGERAGQEDDQALLQFQEDLRSANAVIDSLNLTVDFSNQVIDGLRSQVDSLQRVDEKLYASVQKLSGELKHWREQAAEQRHRNEIMAAQLERLRGEKKADQQTLSRLRREADSLNTALVEANGAIRRQTDHLGRLKSELALAREELVAIREETRLAQLSVHVYAGSEKSLEENGYIDADRALRRALRKTYKVIKKFDRDDPGLRQVAIGEPLPLEGKLKAVVDRYGKLREGDDYQKSREEGLVRITFTNQLLQGAEVVAVLED